MNVEIVLRFLLLIATFVNVNCKLEVKRILPRTGYAASSYSSSSGSDYGPSSWYGKYFGGSDSANSWKGVTPNKWGVSDTTSASYTTGTSSKGSGYGHTPNRWELYQLKQQQTEIPITPDVKASLAFLPTILITPKSPEATVVVGGSVSQRWGTESAQKHRGRWDKMTPQRAGAGGGGAGWGEPGLPEPEPPINEGWGAAGGGGKGGSLGGLKGGGLKGGGLTGGGEGGLSLKGGKGGVKGGGGGGWGQEPIEPPIQDGWGAAGGKGGSKGSRRPMKGKGGKGKGGGGGWGQSAANPGLCGGQGQGGADYGAAEGPLGDYGDYDYGELPAGGDYDPGDYDPGLDGGRFNKRRLRQRAMRQPVGQGGKGVNGIGGKGGGKGGQGLGNKGGGGGGGSGWGNGDKGGDGIGSFWDNPWNLWNVLKFKKRRFGRRPQDDHGHGPPGGPEGEFEEDGGRPGFFGSLGSWLPMVLMGLLFIAEVSLSFGDPFLIPVLAIPLAILVLLRMIYDGAGFGMVALD